MRTINVNGHDYKYKIGERSTVITMLDGKKIVVGNHTIKGLSPDDFDRGKWKKTSDGMIKPSDMERYIFNANVDMEDITKLDGEIKAMTMEINDPQCHGEDIEGFEEERARLRSNRTALIYRAGLEDMYKI